MDLALAPETAALLAALDALLSKESSPARVRAAEGLGFDAALWTSLNTFGIPALALDTETCDEELLVALARQPGRIWQARRSWRAW
jgi:hypothetical protein